MNDSLQDNIENQQIVQSHLNDFFPLNQEDCQTVIQQLNLNNEDKQDDVNQDKDLQNNSFNNLNEENVMQDIRNYDINNMFEQQQNEKQEEKEEIIENPFKNIQKFQQDMFDQNKNFLNEIKNQNYVEIPKNDEIQKDEKSNDIENLTKKNDQNNIFINQNVTEHSQLTIPDIFREQIDQIDQSDSSSHNDGPPFPLPLSGSSESEYESYQDQDSVIVLNNIIDIDDLTQTFYKTFNLQQANNILSREIITEDNIIDETKYCDYHKCLVCLDVCINAVECQTCERIFCLKCIEEWCKINQQKCPQCKERWKQKKQIHITFRNSLSQIEYKCYCEKGVTIDNYFNHYKDCEEAKNAQKQDQNLKQIQFLINGKEIDPTISFFIAYCQQKKLSTVKFVYNYGFYKLNFQDDKILYHRKKNYQDENYKTKCKIDKGELEQKVIENKDKTLDKQWGVLQQENICEAFDENKFWDMELLFLKYLAGDKKQQKIKIFNRNNNIYFKEQLLENSLDDEKYYIKRFSRNKRQCKISEIKEN